MSGPLARQILAALQTRQAEVEAFIQSLVEVESPSGDYIREMTWPIVEGVSLMQVMRALDSAGVDALDLNRRQATLDDVFLTLTGHAAEAAGEEEKVGAR